VRSGVLFGDVIYTPLDSNLAVELRHRPIMVIAALSCIVCLQIIAMVVCRRFFCHAAVAVADGRFELKLGDVRDFHDFIDSNKFYSSCRFIFIRIMRLEVSLVCCQTSLVGVGTCT